MCRLNLPACSYTQQKEFNRPQKEFNRPMYINTNNYEN